MKKMEKKFKKRNPIKKRDHTLKILSTVGFLIYYLQEVKKKTSPLAGLFSAKRPCQLWGKCHTSWIFSTT